MFGMLSGAVFQIASIRLNFSLSRETPYTVVYSAPYSAS